MVDGWDMARRPRIEYAGAVYHLMNRGDHGEEVYKDRNDYEIFVKCLEDCCKRCGWVVHAYCLMRNHFHLLVETPEANLVSGMKWLMGAYTQKYNTRHGLKGHLFQGRYKAQMVEARRGGYFERVATYVHLNPARAGLLNRERPILSEYRQSSYVWYLQREGRPEWLEVGRVLGNMGLKDNAAGRAGYGRHMQERVLELRTRKGRKLYEGECKEIRHEWCLGTEGFEEDLLQKLGKAIEKGDRGSYMGQEMGRHGEVAAERMISRGMKVLGIAERDLEESKCGAREKMLLAWLTHKHAMVTHKWTAERLRMGVAVNLGKYVKAVEESKDAGIVRLRELLKKCVNT